MQKDPPAPQKAPEVPFTKSPAIPPWSWATFGDWTCRMLQRHSPKTPSQYCSFFYVPLRADTKQKIFLYCSDRDDEENDGDSLMTARLTLGRYE